MSTSLHPTDGMLMPVPPCAGAQLLALPEEEAVADLDGDREHIEQADRFEASFNFRFEVRLRRWGHHPLSRAPGAVRAVSDHCLAPCVVRNVLPPLAQHFRLSTSKCPAQGVWKLSLPTAEGFTRLCTRSLERSMQ